MQPVSTINFTRYVYACLLSLFLAGLFACTGASASVGIYRWHPEARPDRVLFHYRLNTEAHSGSITIRRASDHAVIHSFSLSAEHLKKGANTAAWHGDLPGGSSAATGLYYARITVERSQSQEGYFPIAHWQAGRYQGIAVNNNPAANNQANPENSSFGSIYLVDTLAGAIVEYWPEDWAGPDEPLPAPRRTFPLPEGILFDRLAIGPDSRLYSSVRANPEKRGFWSLDPAGGQFQFAPEPTLSQETSVVPTPSEYIHLRASGTMVEVLPLVGEGNWLDQQPLDPFRSAYLALSQAAGIIYGMAGDSGGVFLSAFGAYPAVGHYHWQNGMLMLDPAWPASTLASVTGSAVTGLDLQGGRLAVSIFRAWDNLVLADPWGQETPEVFTPVSGPVRQTRIDYAGNAVVEWAGDGPAARQRRVGVYFGLQPGPSSSTVDTIPFAYAQGNVPPYLDTWFTPEELLPYGSHEATLYARVTDPDGNASLATVMADLEQLGVPGQHTLSLHQAISQNEAVFRLTGILGGAGFKAGNAKAIVSAEDTGGGRTSAAAPIYLQGAVASGQVRHSEGQFGIPDAVVTLSDSLSGRTYTTTSGPGGTFQIQVNPGTYTVQANKPYHHSGAAVEGVQVGWLGVAGLQPTLGTADITEIQQAPSGTVVCVEGVVTGQPAATNWASGGQKGLRELPEAQLGYSRMLVQDQTGAVKVNPAASLAAEGSRIVLQGTLIHPDGLEPALAQITHLVALQTVQMLPQPLSVTLASLPRSGGRPNNLLARVLVINGAVVQADGRIDSGKGWLEFRVVDASTQEPWTIRVWKSLGVTLSDLPVAGQELPLRCSLARNGIFGGNILEILRPEDLVVPPKAVPSPGAARLEPLGRVITFSRPVVVSFVPEALLPGETPFYYVQALDGSSGIRVESENSPPPEGALVQITGILDRNEKEEMHVRPMSVTINGIGNAKVWNMLHSAAGGKGFPESGGTAPQYGVVSEGLLIRITGRVISSDVNTKTFFVYDGSLADNEHGTVGLKVATNGPVPSQGSFISVTGVLSRGWTLGSDPDPVVSLAGLLRAGGLAQSNLVVHQEP